MTAQKASADIIFAIDSSGSMTEELNQVKVNINNFAQTISQSQIDYRVIMIAKKGTSGNTICVPAPLGGPNCSDSERFHHIDQKVNSTDGLQVILDTYDKAWSQYLRPESTKIFVMVTDDNSDLAATDFDTALLAKAPDGMFGTAAARKYVWNSICGWSDGTPVLSETKCDTAENTGDQHQTLSQLTGGMVDSVCKTDYSGVLNNLANGIVRRVGCQLALPKPEGGKTPNYENALVKFTPGSGATQTLERLTDASQCAQSTAGWHYDDNANKSQIVLCPSTCTTVSSDEKSKVDVELTCSPQPPRVR